MKPTHAGSIRERRPGVFEFRLYVGKDPVSNKHRWKSKTWKGNRRDAGKALADWVSDESKSRPGTQQTVTWLLDEYARLLEAENRSASTLRTYKGYVDNWLKPYLGPVQLEKLTAGDVRQLAARMTKDGKSASTVRQVHAILRGALKFAVQHDWVERNVATLATPPKLSQTNVVAATPAEADALYRKAGDPGGDLPTAIALATHTGARLGELCALRWSNIDGSVIHFYSSKTHLTGDVPITATLAQRLTERLAFQEARAARIGVDLAEDPYVLSRVSDGGARPRSDGYSHSFADVRDDLGLPHLHFHTLRHAFVTQALAAGVDPLTVSKLVRHRDMSMIGRVYGHGTAEASQQAAKKIDDAFTTFAQIEVTASSTSPS